MAPFATRETAVVYFCIIFSFRAYRNLLLRKKIQQLEKLGEAINKRSD
jgi:hypothetical protein